MSRGQYKWEHTETTGNVRFYDTNVDAELGRDAEYYVNENKEIVFTFLVEFPSRDKYDNIKAEALFEVKESPVGSYVPMLIEGGSGDDNNS